jgi:ABC-type amino acid transport substrate-binding protein
LKTLVVAAYPEAIKAVGAGKAQATIVDELPADYHISRCVLSDTVVQAGQLPDDGVMTLPVRKDDTVLLGTLNQGMASIDDAEMLAIRDTWMSR